MSPDALFAALGDPTRCRVVELLSAMPRPVHELAAEFSISRPAISRHLRVLKEAGLVKEAKKGRENVYALQRAKMKPVMKWLAAQGWVETAPAPDTAGAAKPDVGAKASASKKPGASQKAAGASKPRSSHKSANSPKALAARKKPATKPTGKAPAPAAKPVPQLSFFDL